MTCTHRFVINVFFAVYEIVVFFALIYINKKGGERYNIIDVVIALFSLFLSISYIITALQYIACL